MGTDLVVTLDLTNPVTQEHIKYDKHTRRLVDRMFPHVLCAVCNKRVDRIEIEENDTTRSFRCTVWCHDRMDVCSLPYDMVEGVEPGWAFIDSAKRIHDAGKSKIVQSVETQEAGRQVHRCDDGGEP